MIRNCIKLSNSVITCSIKNASYPIKRSIFVPQVRLPNLFIENTRFKSKTSKNKELSDNEPDIYENDSTNELEDKYTKIVKINVTSLRVDAILKSSLGVARNKIETLFYESKIRVNGEKIQKKSTSVQVGDEIDLIKGPDLKNPKFMNVARVEVLSIKGNEDSISVKVKRCKSLTVDAYS